MNLPGTVVLLKFCGGWVDDGFKETPWGEFVVGDKELLGVNFVVGNKELLGVKFVIPSLSLMF